MALLLLSKRITPALIRLHSNMPGRFELLPNEILIRLIGTFMMEEDVLLFRQTCGQLRKISDDVLYDNIPKILATTKWILRKNKYNLLHLTTEYLFTEKHKLYAPCAIHDILLFSMQQEYAGGTLYLVDAARRYLPNYFTTFKRELIAEAAAKHHIHIIRNLVTNKQDGENLNYMGDTLSHYYACGIFQTGAETTEMMNSLLPTISHTLEIKNRNGHVPLALALLHGQAECFQWLLPKCNPNVRLVEGEYNAPLLLMAIHRYLGDRHNAPMIKEYILKLIRDKRTLINAADNLGSTALHFVISDQSILGALLQRPDFNPNSKNHQGQSILQFRIASNLCIQALCHDPRTILDEVDEYGETALHHAVRNRSLHSTDALLTKMPKLLNLRSNNLSTPLHYSVEARCLITMTRLLNQDGLDLNARTIYGQSPLLIAAYNGWTEGVLQLSMTEHITLCAIDNSGNNALHLRIRGRYIEASNGGSYKTEDTCLKLLLDLRIDKNLQNTNGQTPLMLAVCTKDLGAVALLLHHGCEAGIADRAGKTVFQYAKEIGDVDLMTVLSVKKRKRDNTRASCSKNYDVW